MTSRQTMTGAQVLTILGESVGRIRESTDGLTESRLHARPEPGEWSVTEILAHLRSCADVWGDAIETIVTRDKPTIRAVNPVAWIERTDYRELDFASSLQSFATQRRGLLAMLGRLLPTDWTRAATVLGAGAPLQRTVRSYGDRMARHERAHWRQVAKTAEAVRAL